MQERITFASCSDVGRMRSRNEDALDTGSRYNWAVLSDGMGGCNGGDVASRLAISVFREMLEQGLSLGQDEDKTVRLLQQTSMAAHLAILSESTSKPELLGMGCTMLATVFLPGKMVCAHLGDSRLYRMRDGELAQLTADHTIAQYMVDSGEMSINSARGSVYRSFLTRGLGIEDVEAPDIGIHAALPGDLYLLCSDGLTDMVEDKDIARILCANASIQARVDALVALANTNGGRDNISVIIASVAVCQD